MISSAEWEIMRVLWSQTQVTSSEIYQFLGQKKGWSISTVKTLLGRLSAKKLITSERQGRAFYYRALVSELAVYDQTLTDVLDKICLTKHVGLLGEQLAKTPMTLSDIAYLEELLLAKKQTAVGNVNCNCSPGQCHCHKGG